MVSEATTGSGPTSKEVSFLYVFSILCTIVGVILSYSAPLHTLSIDNNPTRSYFWNRVETSDNTYHYSDGADYQTQVCWYGGEVLVSFMTIALVASVFALGLHFAELCSVQIPHDNVHKNNVKYQAILTALASILYTISIVNWGTSCLNLTRNNNASTFNGQTLYASVYIVMVVFSAVGIVGAYIGWKRHQYAVLSK